MEEPGQEETYAYRCIQCEYQSTEIFKFCPKCGLQREIRVGKQNPFENKNLVSLMAYFFITIVLLMAYKFTEGYLMDFFQDMVLIHIVLGVLVIVFAMINGKKSFAFGTKNLKPGILGPLLAGLVLFAFIVSFVADFLNGSLSDGYYFDFFALSYPLVTVIGFQCLFPAIFEELAFRGFLLDNIRALSNDHTAIGVSAFLFGIMHLAFIGLLWQIPIGILFGYLRIKYNTLWYGIIGHFVYNLVVTLIERGVF